MYAEIAAWDREGNRNYSPFMTNARLEDRYKLSLVDLQEKYDAREVYGDDEYFDGR